MLFIFAYILHKLTQISHFQDIELYCCLHLSSTIFLYENTSFCIWFVEAVEAMWRQMNFASTILLSKYQLLTSINPQKWKYVGHFSNYSVRAYARARGAKMLPTFPILLLFAPFSLASYSHFSPSYLFSPRWEEGNPASLVDSQASLKQTQVPFDSLFFLTILPLRKGLSIVHCLLCA